MKPVWEIVRETVEPTAEAWKTLPYKDLLPAETLEVVDRQIEKITVGMTLSWRGDDTGEIRRIRT